MWEEVIIASICGPCKESHRLERVPHELGGLSQADVIILRPWVLHQGEPKRRAHGYRRKDSMTRFSWCGTSLHSGIDQLLQVDRDRLTCFYQWLLTHNTIYAEWCAEQEEVVRNGTERKLCPSVLLRPFLECVLWPHL